MILCHANALATAEIFQTSNPSVTYPAFGDVPNADADDWEPVPRIYAPPADPSEDCGCGPASMPQNGDQYPITIEEESDVSVE